MSEPHESAGAPAGESPEERTIMVFLRDTERGLGIGYKTRGAWQGGTFDDRPWSEGDHRCDCVRARIVYGSDDAPCGSTRYVVERIVVWDTGETVYSECGLT